MDNNLTINIYDKKGNVKKTAEARLVDLEFGQVRKLMDLLKIEQVDDTMAMLKSINEAWDEVKDLLVEIFPDVTTKELDSVKLKELIPTLVVVVKYSFAEIVTNIPHDKSKN